MSYLHCYTLVILIRFDRYKLSLCVACLYDVGLTINEEPFNRFASNYDYVNRWNVLSLDLKNG